MKYLHFSLHDVAPAHLERLYRAEQWFELWGVDKVTYLLVPCFHHLSWASQSQEFLDFVRRPRPFEVEWVLHGEFHLENPEASKRIPSPEVAWKRKHMTGGEGEFLALTAEEIEASLNRGIAEFQKCLGVHPYAFVPPAWLYNQELHPQLIQCGIGMTEDHYGIFDLKSSRHIAAPVVTWATRTWLRRNGSLIVCPLLGRLSKNKPLLRVACHPWDFEFSWTVKNLGLVYRHASRRRRSLNLREIVEIL